MLVNNITEELLPESQCGFRKSRSMVDMIFTARQLQEKCREQHQDLFMTCRGGQLHLGQRAAGGQMKRYKDQLKTWLKKCNIKPTDLEDAAADHSTSRQL
jgi:hypothetical protein